MSIGPPQHGPLDVLRGGTAAWERFSASRSGEGPSWQSNAWTSPPWPDGATRADVPVGALSCAITLTLHLAGFGLQAPARRPSIRCRAVCRNQPTGRGAIPCNERMVTMRRCTEYDGSSARNR